MTTTKTNAAVVYSFESFTNFDRVGWSFAGGFIELNAFTGDLTVDNFTDPGSPTSVVNDYFVEFTSPLAGGTTYSLTPSNSALSYIDVPDNANFVVTPSTIENQGPAPSTPFEMMRITTATERVEFVVRSEEGWLNLVDLALIGQPGGANTNGERGPLSLRVASVPEPSAFLALLATFMGVATLARKRQRLSDSALGDSQ